MAHEKTLRNLDILLGSLIWGIKVVTILISPAVLTGLVALWLAVELDDFNSASILYPMYGVLMLWSLSYLVLEVISCHTRRWMREVSAAMPSSVEHIKIEGGQREQLTARLSWILLVISLILGANIGNYFS